MTDRNLLKTVSKNRTFIMGCAMISILLFHQFFISDDSACGFIWKTFHYFGHWGIDVFLFVSGFGIQYSLRKNSISVYYVNRIVRLLPQCIIVGAILGTLHLFGIGGIPIYGTDSLFCIFSSLWLWYIEAVILYYIASPYVLALIDRMKWMAVLLIASACVALLFAIGSMSVSNSSHCYGPADDVSVLSVNVLKVESYGYGLRFDFGAQPPHVPCPGKFIFLGRKKFFPRQGNKTAFQAMFT